MRTKDFAFHFYAVIGYKMSRNTILVCVVACLVQNALSQILSLNNCACQQPGGQAINLGNLGNLGISLSNAGSGLSLANNGNSFSLANPGCGLNIGNGGLSLNLGNSPNMVISNAQSGNGAIQGTSQQIGYGDVAIVGELPVAGPTAVCGNVPVIGYVVFEGDVPAGGLVSVVDPCGCQCNQ